MSLLIQSNSLEVPTQQGIRSIQLCVGSVTKAQNDPVDVLVISAYPGDYTPTRTSVIGALKYDLNVNVSKLSKDKEKDYRKLFSCWWSKKLPNGLPFGRILCFEGSFKKNLRPPSTISEVFRSLVSLCENEEISVMMPLLSTGDQCYSSDMMLRLIVEAAIHWMKIGLPIKVLKIVIYQKSTDRLVETTRALVDYFQGLKDEWMQIESQRIMQDTHFMYDYYITYAMKDKNIADMLVKTLELEYENCGIYIEQQPIDAEKSWQDHIYDVMVTCARVLVILSPAFLEDTSCIEKYNIAMCCSRNMGRNYLAPFYVEELKDIPTYMGLIQYIDIRPVTDESIRCACQSIPTLKDSTCLESDFNKAVKEKGVSLDSAFDVFISYSHKNTDTATKIYKYIKQKKPHWNIFLDQDSLKAGHSWQAKLYSSIEESKAVLALLSSSYFESKVCQEEYNLAKCLYEDPKYSLKLVEVKLETIERWPKWCTPHYLIDVSTRTNLEKLNKILYCLDGDRDGIRGVFKDLNGSPSSSAVVKISDITSLWRGEFAKGKFPIVPNEDFTSTNRFESFHSKADDDTYDVIVICHEGQRSTAELLILELGQCLPVLKTLILCTQDQEDSAKLDVLDKGKILVPLLSTEYVKSPVLMEQFNTALCRHRWSKEIVLCPIIVGKLPKLPAYPLVSFCLFSTLDKIWNEPKGPEPVHSCIHTAAVVLSNIHVHAPSCDTSFKTVLSMRELEEWVFCKERGEKRELLSPLLFCSSNNSGHAILFNGEEKSVNKVLMSEVRSCKTEEISSDENNLLLSFTGSHAAQKLPNEKTVEIRSEESTESTLKVSPKEQKSPTENESKEQFVEIQKNDLLSFTKLPNEKTVESESKEKTERETKSRKILVSKSCTLS